MEETNPRVVSSVDYKCFGAYADYHKTHATFHATMRVYDNGEHITDCDSLGDRGSCQFRRGDLSEIACPFIHDR
jgi:hypothetical protein